MVVPPTQPCQGVNLTVLPSFVLQGLHLLHAMAAAVNVVGVAL
jgi:hypothetical protein